MSGRIARPGEFSTTYVNTQSRIFPVREYVPATSVEPRFALRESPAASMTVLPSAVHRQGDPGELIQTIRTHIFGYYYKLRDAFVSLDANKDGRVSKEEFVNGIEFLVGTSAWGREEIGAVFDRFCFSGDKNYIKYFEFCKAIQGSQLADPHGKHLGSLSRTRTNGEHPSSALDLRTWGSGLEYNSSRHSREMLNVGILRAPIGTQVVKDVIDSTTISDYDPDSGLLDFEYVKANVAEEDRCYDILKQLKDFIWGTSRRLTALFSSFDLDDDGMISIEELRMGLAQIGLPTTDDEAAALVRMFSAPHQTDRLRFCDFMTMIRKGVDCGNYSVP
eukprot:Stramenopile-MAST_4_protein_2016